MYEINNYELRNLQEQVLKNKEEIARHWDVDRVLADFGIKVLGRLNTADPYLTDPTSPEYIIGDNYGDAYTVGEEGLEKYQIYVWTRPNENAGESNPYWLYIGYMTIQGPPGPAGRSVTNVSLNNNYQLVFTFSDSSTLTLAQSIKGAKGDPGINGKTPSITATRETNGVRVRTFNGDGTMTNSVFIPDGKQGAKGDRGERGENATLNIIGTFTSLAQAPNPQLQELGDAFLLSAGTTTTLYVLTGEPDIISTYAWQETSFGGGTRVTVSGQTQSVWSADSKLDKLVGNTHSVYTFIDPWTTNLTPIDTTLSADSIPWRDSKGTFSVSNPTQNNHPATKEYVDGEVDDLQSYISGIEDRVSHLENISGGSGGSGSWNIDYGTTGMALWLNTEYNKRYEVMLISKHGVGDNCFTSPVFLLPSGADMEQAVTNMKIPTLAEAYGANENYWTVNYDPPTLQYSIQCYYNGEPSSIHDITCYFREV